jgi:pentatricopeptide repeat protein
MTDTTTRSSSRGLVLPVLMLLAVAQETRGFSTSCSRRQHLHVPTLQQEYASWRSSRRRLATQASSAQAAPFFWASIEQTSIPSFSSSNNDNGLDLDIMDASDVMVEVALEAAAGPMAHPEQLSNNQHSHNRHHQTTWNGGRKKPKSLNPAMGDPAFLRKRTEKLLRLPTDAALDNNSGNDPHTIISSRGMKGNRNTFHFLIDAWAFSGEMDAAEQAIALLHKMEELSYTIMPSTIQPDVRSYTKVINAISRSASPNAGEMAEDMLDKMNYLYHSGENLAVKPNTFTYTAVVEAHANSGVTGSAQHAEEICEVMVQKYLDEHDPDVVPTARSFNAAINAYAKIGDAQRADDVFRRMEGVYLTTGLEQVKPNAYNYNSLISAWANCGEEGAAQRAEEVLERMEAAYKAGDEEMKPTTVSYNAVIDAYSKVAGGQQGGQHQQLCDASEEEEVEECYNADETGEKAESILRHMEQLYLSGENVDAKPNVRSYNTVINVW